MASLLSHPGFWGFWSALVYAGTALSNGLWLAEPLPIAAAEARRRKHLVASFVLAMIFGLLAAEVFTPDMIAYLTPRLGRPPSQRSVAVGIGLFASPLWPLALKLKQKGLIGMAMNFLTALNATKENPK